MNKLDQQGSAGLLISLVVTVCLLLISFGFGLWAFSSQQNYKNNVDQIVSREVKVAVDKNSTAKDNEFAELQKSPLKSYNGPPAYGSTILKYPKTWSAYVDSSGEGAAPVDAYFNPNYVPSTQTNGVVYALRMQVTSDSYDTELQQFDDQVQAGKVRISPFSFANVKGVVGVKVIGQISENTQGTLILVPLRDKALKLWTESDQYKADFNKYILPNFKFSP